MRPVFHAAISAVCDVREHHDLVWLFVAVVTASAAIWIALGLIDAFIRPIPATLRASVLLAVAIGLLVTLYW
jgi:hypothetical protein